MLGEKEKQKQEIRARANVQTEAHWMVEFFLLKLWLDQGLTGCHVKWTIAMPHRSKLENKRSAVSLYFTDSTFWKLPKKPFLMGK